MGRVTKRARGTIARRVVAAIASAALVLSQALGALAPAVAYASTGTMRVTTETNGGEGFLSFGSDSGSQLFCISPEAHNPTGTTFTRWDYTGEATGILPDPHALAYLVHSMAPGNPLGLERPDQAINVAVWMLCGMDVDLSSGAYSVGRMSGNVYSGAGGRASRADAGKIEAAVADARAHAGKAGAWDRASKVWYSPNGTVQSVVEVLPTGGVELTKSSAKHEVTDANGSYSLEGATYTVYSDEACTQAVATIVTDASGHGSAQGLRAGSYWARETKPARNYALSTDVIPLTVEAGRTTKATATDAPQVNPLGIVLAKADAETGKASPLGAATLKGATFEVRYYDGQYDEGSLPAKATRTWTVTTREDGTADLGSATGDALYRDSRGEACVPVGTVAITETSAPDGYLGDDATHVVHVTGEGTAETVSTYATPTVAEQVRRGDLELVKAESGSMARLAGVPFRITSATTGESHIIVTDENGQASTSSSWAAHTTRTNANDSAGEGTWDASAGVWFSGTADSQTAPDDSKGALPYDTYLVEELPCAANQGLRLVSMTARVTRDATTVNLGTVDDDQGPRIATTLTGEGGEHLAEAAERVELTDEVEYENLVPGKEYELAGTLMDRETGKAVTGADGKAVTATAKLAPKLSTGKAKVTFEFDATGLSGHSVVAFEELSQGGKVVATHADIDDEGQTVLFPKIGTTATDAEDGSHDAAADDDVTITDTVEYESLVPGKEYTLTGTLMDRETGEAVTDAKGEKVTATTKLTPEEASGKATVTFRFDGSDLAGRTVVAFEELSRHGHEYATHADLSDEGQSVAFPQVTTSARDAADGDKVIDAAPGQRVADTVSYSNVTPGTEYRVRGRLLDAETGKELATAETTVTPEPSEGTVEVAFDVDGTGLEGRRLVCTEELSRAGKVVATHANLKDEGQTVSLPGIHTTATDAADGDHEATAADKVAITDRVEWSGLVKGREYTVTGTLMDKSTGERVTGKDGGPVTASATFTADAESGSTDVTFEFDGSALAGHDVVAFETITHDGKTVATHADLEDEGQTVSITEAPPETPKEEKATKGGGQLPKTGDAGAPLATIAGLCSAAGLSLAGARALRRRGRRDADGDAGIEIRRGPATGPDPLGGGDGDE